jgi:eukaryotic-like serine/threonine-protein kinase
MSPEQAQGMEVKASSDVFTVGLILYELLAGIAPFYAESAIASLLLRTQKPAAQLVAVDKNIPGALSNIVAKCLEKEPAKRYPSAAELDEDLRVWPGRSAGKTVAAPSPRVQGKSVRKFSRLHIGIAGGLAVVIAAGTGW